MRNLASRMIDRVFNAQRALAVSPKRPKLWFNPFPRSAIEQAITELEYRLETPGEVSLNRS